jgi:hypothetical protein
MSSSVTGAGDDGTPAAGPASSDSTDGSTIDETALVEVFQEMANESRSNHATQGLNKNCHFCGPSPQRAQVVSGLAGPRLQPGRPG